jgi:hypothetical protein
MFSVNWQVPELNVNVGVQSQAVEHDCISTIWVSMSVHPFESVTVSDIVSNPGEYDAPFKFSVDPVPLLTPLIFQRYVNGDDPPLIDADSVVLALVQSVVAPVILMSKPAHGFEQVTVFDAVTGVVQHPVTVTVYVPELLTVIA